MITCISKHFSLYLRFYHSNAQRAQNFKPMIDLKFRHDHDQNKPAHSLPISNISAWNDCRTSLESVGLLTTWHTVLRYVNRLREQ